MTTAEIKIKEHQQDIEELKAFLDKATRDSVKKALKQTLDNTQEELERLQKAEKQRLERLAANPSNNFLQKIETYGWDQSDKFVKVYITSLKDCSTIKETDVETKFLEKSVDLIVRNFNNNVNYNLSIVNLCFKIVPESSYIKIKKDMIVIFMKKDDVGKEWPGMTEVAMKEKEKKMASLSKFDAGAGADPQESMMSLMKKMYDEGDDEMKRTISKSFMESREKSMNGGGAADGGMPGMGGAGGAPGGMDFAKMMGGMGGLGGGALGGMPDMGATGADGKPDMSKLMSMLGSMKGGEGGAGGMPDLASMMAGLGKGASTA